MFKCYSVVYNVAYDLEVTDEEEFFNIVSYLSERYNHGYTRKWIDDEGYTWIDFGSHATLLKYKGENKNDD